jgi:glucosylceramidase
MPYGLGTGGGTKLHDPAISWRRAANYARDIIGDLKNWVSGWTDWNLVLDLNGGPNWAKNFVDAPILANTEHGTEFYKQPMCTNLLILDYVMGHFSKYIIPGSHRVEMQERRSNKDLEMVAFVTPYNSLVIVIQNRPAQFLQFSRKLSYEIEVQGRLIRGSISKDAIQTVVVNLDFNDGHIEV